MSARHYHKRYHSDALAGMMGLTLEERGAYQTLLDLIYDRAGPLPDNERLLAGYMGCSVRKWRSLRDNLLAQRKISKSDDGILCAVDFDPACLVTTRPPMSAATRLYVFERDDWRCVYCGTEDAPFEVDHVLPVAQGGLDDLDNLVTACRACNRAKGARTPEQWVSA